MRTPDGAKSVPSRATLSTHQTINDRSEDYQIESGCDLRNGCRDQVAARRKLEKATQQHKLDRDKDVVPRLDRDKDVVPRLDRDKDVVPRLDRDKDVVPRLDRDKDVVPRLDRGIQPND